MEPQTYFAVCDAYFWQPEEAGTVLAIPDGATLCYRETMVEVLESFSGRPLPAFGTLLLAVTALSTYASGQLDQIHALLSAAVWRKSGSPSASTDRISPLNEGIAFCKILAALPDRYKRGAARLLVLQTVFEHAHNSLSIRKAKTLIAQARRYPDPDAKKLDAFTEGIYYRDFRTLELLLTRFPTTERILERLAALPPLPDEVLDFQDQPDERGGEKDLLDTLLQTPQTFPVAALVRHLWSGLQIPAHLTLPSDQPFGGTSDLSNRGAPERLLLSEHAYDDLAFLARLASGEALYTARERPPAAETLRRVLLIDTSLKAWGTPHAVAFAVLLAIARHPKTDVPCAAYAVGSTVTPLPFDSVDAVIASLSVLDHSLDASEGLNGFFRSSEAQGAAEVILITPAESLGSARMHVALSAWGSAIAYTIGTTTAGRLDVYKRQGRGKRLLQQLTLPLDALWKRPPAPAADAPAPVPFETCPILFFEPPAAAQYLTLFPAQYAITQTGTIFCQEEPGKGWSIAVEGLPDGGTERVLGRADAGVLLLQFARQTRDVTLVNLSTGRLGTLRFDAWASAPLSFFFHDGAFYHLQRTQVWKFFWRDDRPVMDGPLPTGKAILDAGLRPQPAPVPAKPAPGQLRGNVLKNVSTVAVSEDGTLLLNQFGLQLRDRFLKLAPKAALDPQRGAVPHLHAQHTGDGQFAFADGSTVTVHPAGMLALRSSKNGSVPIFVPSVLQRALAAATPSLFAGVDYFLPKGSPLQEAAMPIFYVNYIKAFTAHILRHGG